MTTAFQYRLRNSDSSDSDSEDSDKECLNWKRVTKNEDEELEKIPIVPPPIEPSVQMQASNNSSVKRKRNTIWCEVLEDQMMSETLNHCLIKNKPKGYGSRGEESYDYTVGKNYRERTDDEDASSRPKKRFKNDTFVKLEPEGVEAAKKIIRVLAEEKGYLIYRVVKHIGIEKALKLLKMTEDIEDSGGLMIKNQERRRTPGGVYLYLLRSDKTIEKETKAKIFDGELNSFENKKKIEAIRRSKGKNHRRNTNKKNYMECETSSPDNKFEMISENQDDLKKNDSEPQCMEEDTSVNMNSECPSTNERTSDLEEGEVE